MNSFFRFAVPRFAGAMLALVCASSGYSKQAAAVSGDEAHIHPLAWDAMKKTYRASPETVEVAFAFSVTNRGEEMIIVSGILSSCGCTAMEVVDLPWRLQPGDTRTLTGLIDTKRKEGALTKTMTIETSAGPQELQVVVEIPPAPDEDPSRVRNQAIAFADRQAVFRNECAMCHVAPLVGKMGAELYAASCRVCHGAVHRASMVPDLEVARVRRDAEYWRRWITDGRDGSLMPAFGGAHGGPLTAEQIESLIAYAVEHLPTEPAASGSG